MTRLRFRVEKLIRDRLPQIMREQGLEVFERRLDDQAFDAALRAKLIEEAHEAADAHEPGELVGELADLTEVMLTLAALHGVTPEEIEARRFEKRLERGGFDERVYNAAVEAEHDLPAAAYYLDRPGQYPRGE